MLINILRNHAILGLTLAGLALFTNSLFGNPTQSNALLEKIQLNRDNQEIMAEILPIVKCSFQPSKYERLLLTKLRDQTTKMKKFREYTHWIGEILVSKVVECLPTKTVDIETPVSPTKGEVFANGIELVSIMRSGDALLETFMHHFPKANVSKILIQRDEETAKPYFIYLKPSATLASGNYVVITEPVIATGGTLDMTIRMLKEKGVSEDKIIIACVVAAPEGLLMLSEKFPDINVVMTVMDEKLNDRKYVVPGLGDCGDRFFGTQH